MSSVCVLIITCLCATVLSQSRPSTIVNIFNSFTTPNCDDTIVSSFNINYIVYNQLDPDNGTLLNDSNLDEVNPAYRTIFLIHGWMQNGVNIWMNQMKDAYLKQEPANIIILDWSNYSTINFTSTFCSVAPIGIYTGDLISNLSIAGRLDLAITQINGFSLGAHIAGYAGQEIQKKTGEKIGRINGLDAAAPGFRGLPTSERLDSSDANFVQAIHTSNYQFGYSDPYGTADFILNYAMVPGCGSMQPGCPFDASGVPNHPGDDGILPIFFCNHLRSIIYFTESINSTNFHGVPCRSCNIFGLGFCSNQPTVVMGEHCASSTSGVFYLKTNKQHPFAEGAAGV